MAFEAQLRMARPDGGRHKFLKVEDDMLRNLVAHFGERNWIAIASVMKWRTPRQCRERYKYHLAATLNNLPWCAAEEALLTAKVGEFGPKWSKIARFFDGRSDVNVKNHWAVMKMRDERVQRFSGSSRDESSRADEDDSPWPTIAEVGDRRITIERV